MLRAAIRRSLYQSRFDSERIVGKCRLTPVRAVFPRNLCTEIWEEAWRTINMNNEHVLRVQNVLWRFLLLLLFIVLENFWKIVFCQKGSCRFIFLLICFKYSIRWRDGREAKKAQFSITFCYYFFFSLCFLSLWKRHKIQYKCDKYNTIIIYFFFATYTLLQHVKWIRKYFH